MSKIIAILIVVIVSITACLLVSYSPPEIIDESIKVVTIVDKYNKSYSVGGVEIGVPIGDTLGLGIQSGKIGIKIGENLVVTPRETRYRYYLVFDNGQELSVSSSTYSTFDMGSKVDCLVTVYDNGNIREEILLGDSNEGS